MNHIIELARALRREGRETRIRVARAFRELEDPRAEEPLLRALGDEDNRSDSSGG